MPTRLPTAPAVSRWDRLLPWAVSITLNFGFALVAVFILYVVPRAFSESQTESIIAPSSFEDPSLSQHPGGAGPAADPTRDERDRLNALARSQGWSQSDAGPNVSQMLGSTNDAPGIFAGNGASVTPGKGASLSAYGVPSAGAGSGPRSTFYGTGGNAVKIVYLIDRTGSLMNFYDPDGAAHEGTVKAAVVKSVSNLDPRQFFTVLVFTGDLDGGTTVMGPDHLVRADPETKAEILGKFRTTIAEGGATDDTTIFVTAFKKAFTFKPELIYFFTDGDLSDTVIEEVRKLNPDHSVHINAIMFNDTDSLEGLGKERMKRMDQLAKENGGVAKLVNAGNPN